MYIVEDNRIVLKNNEEIVGHVFFKKEGNVVSIIQVYVDPKYRSLGYANKLMAYTVNYFKNKNMKLEMICSYAKKWIERGV